MKIIIYKIYSCVLLLLLSTIATAQVTIGSLDEPANGVLLQLKENLDGTSKRGLGLSRVKLSDIYKLKMGDSEILDGTTNEYAAHTGLTVYHVSEGANPQCATIPEGIYTWTGQKWHGVNTLKTIPPTIKFSYGNNASALVEDDYIDLPSGADFRDTKIVNYGIEWTSGKPLKAINTPILNGGISFVTEAPPSALNGFPLGPFSTSPTSFVAMTQYMTVTPLDPWKSKESEIVYSTLDECGRTVTKTVRLNQTNYATHANGAPLNTTVVYKSGGMVTFPVKANARWKTSKQDPHSIIWDGNDNNPIIGDAHGSDLKDGSTHTVSFQFLANFTANKYERGSIIFSDTQSPIRFSDITVSVVNCMAVDPLLDAWRNRLYTVNGGPLPKDVPAPNGVAWHEDQEGNIFFSNDFGATAGRWMINNLAAKSFSGSGRTGTDNLVVRVMTAGVSAAASSIIPYWAYPKTPGTVAVNEGESAQFAANKRLGLLYNWQAATNSKSGTNGAGSNINEGGVTTLKRQGICPNGWHLPNDYEWTQLENSIIYNTRSYSTFERINNSPNSIVQDPTSQNYRGTLHGSAMKDACEPSSAANTLTAGSSLSVSEGGFSMLLAGYASVGSAYSFGANGYMWTSSSNVTGSAWSRFASNGDSRVYRNVGSRIELFSVRCKMD